MCGVSLPKIWKEYEFKNQSWLFEPTNVTPFNNCEEGEKKGKKTEEFVFSLLNRIFEGETLQTRKGSRADKEGIDLLHNNRPIQIKSSVRGVKEFLSKGTLKDTIVVLWVDPQNPKSRKKCFLFFYLSLKIDLKNDEIRDLIKKVSLFKEKINSLPILRGRVVGFSKEEIDTLLLMGLLKREGNEYIFL